MTAVTYDGSEAAPIQASVKRKSFFRTCYDRIVEARMVQAEREIARYRHLLPNEFELAGRAISPRTEDALPFIR